MIAIPCRICLIGLMLALSACATVGRSGKLGFSYRVEDSLFRVSAAGTRIARGGKVTLLVPVSLDRGQRRAAKPGTLVPAVRDGELTIHAATSSDPRVVEVERVTRARVVLVGRRLGSSVVRVKTSRGADSIRLRVDEIHRIELTHLAGKLLLKEGFPRRAAFLAGGKARLHVERFARDGARLAGHGLTPAVTVEPPRGAVVEIAPLDERHIDVRFGKADEVALAPRNGRPLRLRVVSPHKVKALEFTGWDLPQGLRALPRTISRARGVLFRLQATLSDGTLILGLDGVARLESLTPHICSLQTMARWLGDGVHGLKAEAAGECHLQARLGSLTRELVLEVVR